MLRRLKRWLRPLRPVLLPIWRPIRPYVARAARIPSLRSAAVARIAPRRRRVETRLGRIRPINRAEFDEVVRRYPYYRGRWPYMSAAAREGSVIVGDARATPWALPDRA